MISYDVCPSETSRVLRVESFTAVEDGGSYSSIRRLWSAIYDKVFECAEHSADRRSSLALPGLLPHMARRSTHLLQEFSWEMFNHHPPYPGPRAQWFPSFLTPQEIPVRSVSAFSEWQRGGDECHSGSNPRQQNSTTQDTKVGPTVWQMSHFRRWICEKIAQHLLYLFQ